MSNKDNNKDQGDSGTRKGTMGGDFTSPQNAHHANHDLSQEREARDATLAKQVVETIAREMAKALVYYQAFLNERGATAMSTVKH